MKTYTIAECLDVLDWFDDTLYDYVSHILLSKLDGEARITRVLPELCEHADELIASHRGTESVYPEETLCQPA